MALKRVFSRRLAMAGEDLRKVDLGDLLAVTQRSDVCSKLPGPVQGPDLSHVWSFPVDEGALRQNAKAREAQRGKDACVRLPAPNPSGAPVQ